MSDNYCPECGEKLALELINIAEGVALCAACGSLSRLSEVASRRRPIAEALRQPPRGCAVLERGRDIVMHATLRSVGLFFGSLFISLFWNGIVSLFVLVAVEGLYTNLAGPLPPWFPAPKMQEQMTLGMALFLCLFLVPFVTIGSLMLGALVLSCAGKVEVCIGDDEAKVRTGVGFLCWRQRFDPTVVRCVTIGTGSWDSNGKPSQVIVLEADRTIKFGSLLQDDRREWLQVILHTLLTTDNPHQRREFVVAQSAPRL